MKGVEKSADAGDRPGDPNFFIFYLFLGHVAAGRRKDVETGLLFEVRPGAATRLYVAVCSYIVIIMS